LQIVLDQCGHHRFMFLLYSSLGARPAQHRSRTYPIERQRSGALKSALNETTAATAVKLKRKRPKQDATHLTKNNTTGLSTNNER
jgi:hypothetical protein